MVKHTPAGALADGPGHSAGARGYAAVPVPVDVAQRALRLEALLGNPEDPANPYGTAALAAAAGMRGTAPRTAAPEGITDKSAAWPDAAQFVRGLRPLLRRDLGLADAWVLHPLRHEPAHALARLLGSAALLAATGGVLHTTAAIVDGRARHDPAARQWLPVLAAVFADLLACEALTTVALRGLAPADDAGALPVAATGYLVPHLVSDLVADLELVLQESEFGPDSTERRVLAALEGHRSTAGVDGRAALVAQQQLVRAPSLRAQPAALPELFRLAGPAPGAGATRCTEALLAVLPDTAPHCFGTDDGDGMATHLTQVGRRLATEQRHVHRALRAEATADPDGAPARALADRLALVLQASAVLGVARAAAQSGEGFLGRPEWALLALRRIGRRLGLPLPVSTDSPAHASLAVWTELAERVQQRVDCDLYATRLLW
ncbi:hypothetical protein [Streptomyces sp. N35]|uniref:hypothetical protein n=1 Tax=Streptomyces sp. N35 TaxID=2795730 RepID=UPI001F1A0782|nr:hypothetical protein [Streptomyces sp. N35]